MTQEQYKWLKDNGYDPTVQDVDDQGNIFDNPINAPAPQKEVMSMPRAFGTSFLGNLIPSAASLAGGAAGLKGGAALGAPFGPVGIGVGGFLGGVGGSLGAGYLTGKGQQAVLENYAPEAITEMQRAETDQPVASWAGGSAPALLTFKPSFKGISGLSAPLMSQGKGTMTKFAPAAIDVGVNAASAGAGQLVNMSEGGEFSAPRFLADTAFGTIVSNPNALGRKMGFPSLDAPNIPKTSVEQPMDLEALRATEGMTPEEVAQYKTKPQMEWWKQDEATRISDIENVAKQAKQKLNKGMADELSRLPEVYDVIKNPEKFPEFLANSLEEALNVSHESAQDKKQDKFLKLKEQERRANLNAEANEAEGYFKAEVDQARSLQEANTFREATANDDATLRAQAVQAENDLRIANAKTEAARVEAEQNAADTRKLQDLDAAQALSDEAAARLQALYSHQSQLRAETQNKSPAERRGVKKQGIADIAQAKQELADARAIADDLYSRLQSAGGKGLLNQADLDTATKLAAQRGLRIVPATPEQQAKGIRGAYVVNENGEGIIYINPFAATADTAIHEIGHDVFKRSPNERMRRSLMDTAEGSEAYKAEYAARIAAQDKNGKPVHTEQQARDIALEEGIVQAFGEAYPNVKPGEIRQWFNALKASVKSMAGMKISPEDALAWMHYATTEAVPWKGVAVAKTGVDVGGEERMQRAQQETPAFKNWFGESKVVDADGKPLTVYHGTSKDVDFNSFKGNKNGIWFTPDTESASSYAMQNDSMGFKQGYGYKMEPTNRASRVIPAYVSIENPAIFDVWPNQIRDATNYKKALGDYFTQLKAQGHDGVIFGSGKDTVYVAFNPEQVKSATANKGTFDPLNKDIRYQRPTVGKAKDMAQETLNRVSKFAEVDNLESRGGIHAVVAKAMKAFYATRSFMEGRPQAFEKAMYDLSPERRVMLGKHIGQEFDQQRFIKPSSEIAAAYNEYRNVWQKFGPTETNKAGHTVRTAGGQRARLTDPYYGPFHMWNDNVRDIMTTKQGSPEYVKLQDDYIKQHVQAHQQRGIPLQEAKTRAAAEFADEVRTMSVPYDPTAAGTFAGARKAQGIPLPDSWREYDIVKLIKSYDRRSAIDFAMQEHMEKSPQVMAALGAKTFFNDQPIPAQIKAAIPDISSDKSVQSILREMSGQPARKPDEVASGASRAISSLTIGTVSKATEIPTTMIAGLRYLQMSDYLPGTMKFIEKLADWSALQERSYASGLNKRDASQNMRQVSGVAENAAGFLNKFAEGVSSVTGLNQLEKAARTLAQGWGEVLVQINKNKAATGDKDAVRMLDSLSPDWRTRSDADLAAQFGKLMQGSYDMTQLPAWMLESGAAPYLTWSKWSAGQYSNFVKFAIEPAMQGNVKPLIGHLLIGVMGGAAVDQIREWMNNREGRDVNWNELESWMQQNQGQLGAEGMKQLSVKLLNIVQGVGTFGIAGDLAKMVTTAYVGGTAQGMATAPVANAVFDTSKKVAAALKAIDDGEDFGLVLRQAMGDIAQTHIQVARVGRNWLDEQENLRYDDRRQRRLFDELTGAPTQAGTFSVNYGNLAERAFERGNITEKTGEEAFSLVSDARKKATSPEDYASRIRKLKTSQNAIMPSLERQPMKAARYLGFVEGAEPGKGSETLKRYYTRQNEDKYRKSLIEGMSGIR